MFWKLKQTIRGQLLLASLCYLLCLALYFLLDFQPRVRLTFAFFFFGAAAAIVISGLCLSVCLLSAIALRVRGGRFLEELQLELESVSVPTVLRGALLSGFTEGFFLIGFVFAPLLVLSPVVAFSVILALAFALYFPWSSKNLLIALVFAVQTILIASLYYVHNSLFLVAVAQTLASGIIMFVLKSQLWLKLLQTAMLWNGRFRLIGLRRVQNT